MLGFLPPPFIAMAVFLVIGLVVYERTGLRLGGVVVLPLLLVYALVDLKAVWMFGIIAAATFAVGHAVHERTLLYGRRLFILFLVVGLGCSAIAMSFLGMGAGSLMLALLPGIFAFNLHREGNYAKGTSAFMLWLGIVLAASTVVVWVVGAFGGASGVATAIPMGSGAERILFDGGGLAAAAVAAKHAGGAAE